MHLTATGKRKQENKKKTNINQRTPSYQHNLHVPQVSYISPLHHFELTSLGVTSVQADGSFSTAKHTALENILARTLTTAGFH